MKKFKVLERNAIFMNLLGIRAYRFDRDSNDFFQSFGPYYILFVALCAAVSSTLFIQKNWPHLDIVSPAITCFIGVLHTGSMFVSFGLNMKTVKKVHRQLQGIVDEQGDRIFLLKSSI